MNFKIYFTAETKRKLDLYIQLCDTEVSGLGKVQKLENGAGFLVTDVFLLEQECSLGGTQLSPEAVADFLAGLVERGEDPKHYRLWWHSHCDASCFWSSLDEKTIRRMGCSWLVSVVGNQCGEYRGRIDVFDPVHLSKDKVPVDVYLGADDEQEKAIKAELEQKVHRKPFYYPVESRWSRDWYRGWYEWGDDDDEEEDED